MSEKQLKVWWIPQVPMNKFEVAVRNLREAALLLQVLADYDAFQFLHRVKPDYCNAGGLMQLDEDGEWTDWYDDDSGDDFDEYLANHPELEASQPEAQA